MEVILARSAGFCFGVKRAMDKVDEQIRLAALSENHKPIYTYGPIIHNETVVADLEAQGVSVLEEQDLDRVCPGTLILRSHGVPRSTQELLESKNMDLVDATCPFVKRIHRIVEEESAKGRQIVIIGNAGHPEVEGIMGWSHSTAVVIESEEEARAFKTEKETGVSVVSQTTFNYNKFQYLVEILKENVYDIIVANTICNATEERQTEAKEIAAKVDAMIVIGGKSSSNTRKLYEICRKECGNTCLIQTLDDLHLELPETAHLVGITAGASTPNKIIEEVQNYVRINF